MNDSENRFSIIILTMFAATLVSIIWIITEYKKSRINTNVGYLESVSSELQYCHQDCRLGDDDAEVACNEQCFKTFQPLIDKLTKSISDNNVQP